jgi:proline dehydrogenase
LGIKQSLLYRIAKRWIAGRDAEGALRVARRANDHGMRAILNYLGEEVSERTVAVQHANEYYRLQRLIAERGINGCISVKLTQVGSVFDGNMALESLLGFAKEGKRLNQDVWVDMESSANTEKTISTYLAVREKYENVGIAIQAYMKRSGSDLSRLLSAGGRVRLVKGAYKESAELVYKSRSEISKNYLNLMRLLFEEGDDFAIATHDSKLIEEARKLADSHHVSFEFEMLKGIRDELKGELVNSGYKVSDYLPYGDQWYSYSLRRIREHPSNIWLLIRSLF